MFDLSSIGVKKNIPKVNFTSYSGLFIAEPKFGKTTTASKFPNAVLIPFEEGTKGAVANVVEGISTWENFLSFISKLEENRDAIGSQIQTIVFDTVNKAWEKCEPYTLKKLSVAQKKRYKTPSEVPHGGYYPAQDKNFTEALDRILNLGFSILFLSHSKVKTIRPKDGEAYDVYSSTMPDRLQAIVNPLVDFIIYGERKVVDGVKTRVLVTRGSEMATGTGNRVYMESDIAFETEEEAMEKYQEKFKESIMERLQKAGVTEDYDTILKQQEEEKMQKVKEYIENNKTEKASADIIAEVDKLIKDMSKEQQDAVKKRLKDEVGSINYKKYEEVEKAEKALEICKEIVGM